MTKSAITILSSFSDDILVDPTKRIIAEQEGGPALFIEQALLSQNLPYTLLCGDRIKVEILLTPEGEYGKIMVPPKQYAPQADLLTDWTIVSTVLNEWNITSLEALPRRLFIDLQGFVRKPGDFGQRQRWSELAALSNQVFCLKGTEEEVNCLPKAVKDNQKTRLLVVTYGDKGTDVFYEGKRTRVIPQKVSGLENTIGAGDTFLAYLVASMYRGNAPVSAAKCATQKTTEFLKQKLTTVRGEP